MKRYTVTALTSVTIPASATSINAYQYAGCPITSIDIPYGVTIIDNSAFELCQSLTSVNIPTSVTFIGSIIDIVVITTTF